MPTTPDRTGDAAFVEALTDDDTPSRHSIGALPLKFRLIFVAMLSLIATLMYGVGAAGLAPDSAHWPEPVTWSIRLGLAAATVLLVVTTLLANAGKGSDSAGRVAHVLLGVGWILFSWTLLVSLVRIPLPFFGIDAQTLSRVTSVAIAVIVVALSAGGFVAARRVPAVRETTVSIPGLQAPLSVAVLTDTHFDGWTTAAWARAVVERVNGLGADIVVHAGDLADGSVAQRRDQVAHLADIKAGVRCYIAGNHEYYSDAAAWLGHMGSLGWSVLVNQHLVVPGLVIAGIDDPTGTGMAGRGPDLDAALSGAPDLPVLLLAHQPHQVHGVLDRVDLQISGHTHGGQIWPFHHLVKLREPVVQGLARMSKRTQIYVSRGTGFWGPPFRVFAPSEISLLRLEPCA